jgi:hypothetical protein
MSVGVGRSLWSLSIFRYRVGMHVHGAPKRRSRYIRQYDTARATEPNEHIMISLCTGRRSSLINQSLVCSRVAAGPEILEPLIRVLRLVHIRRCSVEACDSIACQVVQGVLLIGPGADRVRNSLHIVADFLVDHELDVLDLRVLDAVLVAEVGVDYAHAGAVYGDDVLDGDVALCLVQAVAAGLVEGAEGFGVEAGDVELAAQRVVLEDLVLGIAGSAADDAELGVESLGCKGVFADVFPPH